MQVRWVLVRMFSPVQQHAQVQSTASPPHQETQYSAPEPALPQTGQQPATEHTHTAADRNGSRRVLQEEYQEYLQMREAVLSSHIVQEDLARFQAAMRGTRTPLSSAWRPSTSFGRRRQGNEPPGTVHENRLGEFDPDVPAAVPQAGDLPRDLYTPAAVGTPHRHGANAAVHHHGFGVSDAMVGTEVAALVLQSPLWSVLSPSLTGRSNRTRQ